MSTDLNTLIQIVQALSGLATVATLIFLWRQVVVANQQRRLDYDKSGVEFVLSVEGQVDGIYEALLSASPTLIRRIYADDINQKWTDEEVKEYWYCRRLFGHIARMAYLMGENPGEFGMSKEETERFLRLWLEELRNRIAASPIMRRYVEIAVEQASWNEHIRRHAKRILEEMRASEPQQEALETTL